MPSRRNAIVVGAGPNGLAAAITLAEAGWHVVVYEAAATAGGGARSGALTLPGFTHDLCSSIYPMGIVSPCFSRWPLARHGLEWVQSPISLAHPFDDGTAAVIYPSIDRTADLLGRDGRAYRRTLGFVAASWPKIAPAVLGPVPIGRHLGTLSRFGRWALQPASRFVRSTFATSEARALVAGIAAHGMLPLNRSPTAAVALVLGALAHVGGWPAVQGGASRLTDALVAHLESLGGRVIVNAPVRSLRELAPADAVLCDLSPRPFAGIAGEAMPARYRRRLDRYRYGPGVFKIDWALRAPIPWTAQACREALTVHACGTLEEIEDAEREPWAGRVSSKPYVLLVQPSLADSTRAPAGQHTAWGYCHVPRGWTGDMVPAIEAQVERFAPGFTRLVLAKAVSTPADLESRNMNLVGGDIGMGVTDLGQMWNRLTWLRHETPIAGVYLCSASTAPGVGVHGMCGRAAALRVLARAN